MKKYISRLHYLTQDLPNRSHTEQVQEACEAGAVWIQYRCLSKTDEELLEELHSIASICDDWGTTLIITNHYHLLPLADIQGVYIEAINADLKLIRNEIGENKTLGASANTFEQIINQIESGADYIGCGPFAHFATKSNQYIPLGYEGYKNVAKKLKDHHLEIPLIATGGIQFDHVAEIMESGIYGIAVSGAINHSDYPGETYKAFHQLLF